MKCTVALHEQWKISRPKHLVVAGAQIDDDGSVQCVVLHCTRCNSTLYAHVTPARRAA